MRVRVVRRGGLAGIALSGEAETSELSTSQAKIVEDRLHGLPSKPAAAPSHPDGFQYEIAFTDSDGQSRTVVLDEAEVGDDLRALIQLAMQRGTLG